MIDHRLMPFMVALLFTSFRGPFLKQTSALTSVSTSFKTLSRRFVTTNSRLSMSSTAASKHTLYDMPVSNNGARCRIVLYHKNIPPEEVQIETPLVFKKALRDPEYLKLNPQGKMPLLVGVPGVPALPESDTICRYLLSTYKDQEPSFLPDHPGSNLVARLHDMYLTTIQGCLYKPKPPFGSFANRSEAIAEFSKQMKVIEDVVTSSEGVDSGPYLFGADVSLADATLFPTMVFANRMLPKFGSDGDPDSPALPPKLAQWFETVRDADPHFARVYEEMTTALDGWDSKGRWDKIWLAGLRDEAPSTLFDKIISGEIPATVVHQDKHVMAFADINPAAPEHVLVIPKDRMGLTRVSKASPEHVDILGRMMVVAGNIAAGFEDGGRLVINDGPHGGQEVDHLHIHVLGGRQLTWPPG